MSTASCLLLSFVCSKEVPVNGGIVEVNHEYGVVMGCTVRPISIVVEG